MAVSTIVGQISSIINADIDAQANIDATKLAIRNAMKWGVNLTTLRVWDAMATNLPGTAASDDLAFVHGTWGTAVPTIQAGNVSGLNTTRYARFKCQVPANYVAAQNLSIRLRAGMLTAVASSACTVDLEVYRCGQDGLVDAGDLCATAAQSMNSTSFADKDFAITATTLLPGDELDVRIAIAFNDGATPTTTPCISNIWILAHTQG